MRDLAEVQGAAVAAAWNRQWPPGTRVVVVGDLGEIDETTTRSHAWTLGHGAAVVLLAGRRGGWGLERIIPMNPKQRGATDETE